MTPEEKMEQVKSAVSKLSEYFDSVQILTTSLDAAGATESFKWGSGNWFARIGLARDFIEYEQGMTSAKALHDSNQTE